MDLLDRFRTHLATLGHPPGRAVVAVSGGPDSVALLDLLVRSTEHHHLELVVAHFDHGIHPDSAAIATRVGALARDRGLAFESGRVELGPHAGETVAREARYRFLESVRVKVDAAAIFLAHHAGDQAETVLMRVLSGSGPAGLAGMDGVNGALVRPLLPFTRGELAQYVRNRSLPVWIDPANADDRHQRAWLRTQILPLIRERISGVDSSLIRVARQSRRDRSAWNAVLDLIPGLDLKRELDGISVAGAPLRGLDSKLVESLLLAVARRVGCPLGPVRAQRVWSLIERGVSGSEVALSGGWRGELSFGRLRLVRPSGCGASGVWSIGGEQGEVVWGLWRLRWSRQGAPGQQDRVGLTAWFAAESLTVRAWEAGEKVRPLAGSGRRLVVRCFQDAKVPRSRRIGWPVVVGGEEVVWVPGVCRSDALVPPSGSEALRVDAELV
ncbi:MAG TPA: tRNA lysidine(34) synthetase TilS [Gemmatimonadales bacterium]|jgi:tRNA(Ile)-lysidine synthase